MSYEVVAIDLSRVAIEHLEERPAIVEELAAWLRIKARWAVRSPRAVGVVR